MELQVIHSSTDGFRLELTVSWEEAEDWIHYGTAVIPWGRHVPQAVGFLVELRREFEGKLTKLPSNRLDPLVYVLTFPEAAQQHQRLQVLLANIRLLGIDFVTPKVVR